MSLAKVYNDIAYYTCLSSDISESKLAGASVIGSKVYATDTKAWYVVLPDLTLASFAQGEINIGGALPAGEAQLGHVGTPADLVDVTLVLDNGVQYALGDVMAITALINGVARVNDGKVYPYLIQVVDEDDQGQGLELWFFRSNVSVGTINNPFSIDDAGSRDLLGWVSIAATDFVDFGNFRVATLNDNSSGWHMGLWEPVSGTRNIYFAAISRGTGTYTTTGIRLKISVGQN